MKKEIEELAGKPVNMIGSYKLIDLTQEELIKIIGWLVLVKDETVAEEQQRLKSLLISQRLRKT